ncbi:hypothetical protein [Nitrospirillum sp. BR 11163]|uniref:hypothetical protein n=1 Tax=Nitrospirillum sp. BR 11163 TaxID=3104323 RepID=UPI002AFFBA5F|nr:hypothetical protein [Nitrospirillum sp. BR 11163]MEA1675326.1 hypothetical protein [Nitrospirillum sp. BR 11163]
MDLSQLQKLGKVAGVPGIALGVIALALYAIAGHVDAVPETWRGPILAIGIIITTVAGLAIVLAAWVKGAQASTQVARAEGDHSPATNIDRTKSGGSQDAHSTGAKSPASNVRE